MLSTGTKGSSGLRKPQGGVLSTARGQEGQGVPWEEGEMRPDKNSKDDDQAAELWEGTLSRGDSTCKGTNMAGSKNQGTSSE